MANVDFSYAPGRTLRYLDASPMIAALREQPEDFEFTRGSLEHIPSRHRFYFDRRGGVRIEAHCRCAAMEMQPEQSGELAAMFDIWRRDYWTPIATNRDFASHFSEPNAFVRLFRDIRMAFRRFRRREARIAVPADSLPAPAVQAE